MDILADLKLGVSIQMLPRQTHYKKKQSVSKTCLTPSPTSRPSLALATHAQTAYISVRLGKSTLRKPSRWSNEVLNSSCESSETALKVKTQALRGFHACAKVKG